MNPITFSTLACPQWSLETIIANAAAFGYDGLEWRGGPDGHVQPEMPAERKVFLRQACADHGLVSLAVTAYTSFTSFSAAERQANVDELRRYADLAAELRAPYVRAFLGELPHGLPIDSTVYEQISDCLHKAAKYSSTMGIKIAVEPHDDFVRSIDVAPLFEKPHPAQVAIWDIGNTFAAGEETAQSFEVLSDHLAYVQVKDGRGRGESWQLCTLGDGDVPLAKAFELLLAKGYQGSFSVEWEYAWHPELDPPEIALPSALQTVRKLLTAAQPESA